MVASVTNNRLRQIAILVASVDAESARHLLLSLPSEIGRKIRQMAAEIGPVPPEERRALMHELRMSCSILRSSENEPNTHSAWSSSDGRQFSSHSPSALPTHPILAGNSSNTAATQSEQRWSQLPTTIDPTADSDLSPAWTKLSTDALVRFVRHERPTVIAVILHQLPPQRAAWVLQKLPCSLSRQVLRGLQNLQEIDPEAMAAIDEHLSHRLSEYRHQIESELENTNRINQLLAAAPPELKHRWSQWLSVDPETVDDQLESSQPLSTGTTYDDSFFSQWNSEEQPRSNTTAGGPAMPMTQPILPIASTGLSSHQKFSSEPNYPELSEEDRQDLQREFEDILSLPPEALAQLLSRVDSHSILLSLAGAHPQFIKRFNAMLETKDAKILEKRLKRIGPVHLREIDQAQKRVVETFRAFCATELNVRAA